LNKNQIIITAAIILIAFASIIIVLNGEFFSPEEEVIREDSERVEDNEEEVIYDQNGESDEPEEVEGIEEPEAEKFEVNANPYQAYNEALEADKPMVVEFYADWCGACVMMEPVIMALKEQYAGEVEFIVADVDLEETGALLEMDRFEAMYIPTFYFINSEGETVSYVSDVLEFEEMQERIDPIIENAAE